MAMFLFIFNFRQSGYLINSPY